MNESFARQPSLAGWTIIFDLDGTLVESAPDLLAALNHAVGPLGVPPVALEEIRTMIGHGAKAMMREAFRRASRPASEAEIEQLWPTFLDYYSRHIAVHSHAFDGVEAALTCLSGSGAVLGVCTNKTQVLSDQLLGELGLAHHFAAVVGADSVPEKKPHRDHLLETVRRCGGEPARAIMIGDSRTDEKAAQNAGLPFIFVPFGYEGDAAEDIHCVSVLSHYDELFERILAVVAC